MSRYYVIGDVHGLDSELRAVMSGMVVDSDTYVIMCGDVGLICGDSHSWRLFSYMKSQPCTFVVMRGNHDARYWKTLSKLDDDMEVFNVWGNQMMRSRCKSESNIWYVRDEGGLYDIPGVGKCLFVPGAYSVDKWYRLRHGLAWEREEQLSYAEMDALIDLAKHNHIDYVFSHTCPLSWCDQFKDDLFFELPDQQAIDHSMEKWLDVLYDIVRDDCKMWYFGHFHDDRGIVEGGLPYDPLGKRVIGIMLYRIFDMVGGEDGK